MLGCYAPSKGATGSGFIASVSQVDALRVPHREGRELVVGHDCLDRLAAFAHIGRR